MNSSDKVGLLPGVTEALHRSAQQARVIAARTGTPLVTSENGRIKKQWIDSDTIPGRREDFEHFLKAVPDVAPSEADQLS